jgi:Uncharacterized protein conserved in bacteria (DUF2252)
LQVKEAEASVLEEILGPGEFANHGERVVAGQRLMQASSDIFLGWVHVISPIDGNERDFYVRQLRDWKGSAEVEQMIPPAMAFYGKLCGQTLARAHARSGDRIAIASYLGNANSFDRAIVEFSKAYAEQNERDYRRLVAAVKIRQDQSRNGALTLLAPETCSGRASDRRDCPGSAVRPSRKSCGAVSWGRLSRHPFQTMAAAAAYGKLVD